MSDTVMNKPEDEVAAGATEQVATMNPTSSPAGKGKEKSTETPDESMETDEDDEDDDDEDDDEVEIDDDEEDDDDFSEIDPSAIISSGRPRRSRPPVDYASEEAMKKAGIDPAKVNEDDE